MLLKSFSYNNNEFISTNPLVAHGYVQIKKEQHKFSIVIQINNFINPCFAYLVCGTNIAKIKINSSTTTAEVGFAIQEYACLIIQDYNLFACKNGTNGCKQAYQLIKSNISQSPKVTTLEKIFGTVYDTYFFDCIKPKLATLFSMGTPIKELSEQIHNSKWISLEHNGQEKVFGVVYKNKFAYAIAIGVSSEFEGSQFTKLYKTSCKTYNILFLSASNGKIISF